MFVKLSLLYINVTFIYYILYFIIFDIIQYTYIFLNWKRRKNSSKINFLFSWKFISTIGTFIIFSVNSILLLRPSHFFSSSINGVRWLVYSSSYFILRYRKITFKKKNNINSLIYFFHIYKNMIIIYYRRELRNFRKNWNKVIINYWYKHFL